ncbi:MAG: hypothetical protein CL846_01830 [Crocinitomicaceae bacterium]|nr:hypothetical protein [Crocinitomicaceae bacterium]
MKSILNILTLLLIVFFSTVNYSQQNAYVGHYTVNPFLLNPSLAGENSSKLFLNYRKQWVGFLGAPETQNITYDSPFKKKKIAFGFRFTNDITNIVGYSAGFFTFKYKINLTKNQNFNFGISAGAVQNRINFNELIADSPNEATLFNSNQNSGGFDMNFGFAYKWGIFTLGGVGYNLLENKVQYSNNYNEQDLVFSYIRHFNAHAQLDFNLNKKGVKMSPIFLMRSTQGMQPQYDGNLLFDFNSKFLMNLNYRHEIGYGLTMGTVIENRFTVAYTYEMSSNNLQNESSAYHEFSLIYKLGNASNGSGNAELQKIKNQNIKTLEKTDFLEANVKKLDKDAKKQKELLKSYIDGLQVLRDSIAKDKKELKEFISSETKKINSQLSNKDTSSNSEFLNSDFVSKDELNKSIKEEIDVYIKSNPSIFINNDNQSKEPVNISENNINREDVNQIIKEEIDKYLKSNPPIVTNTQTNNEEQNSSENLNVLDDQQIKDLVKNEVDKSINENIKDLKNNNPESNNNSLSKEEIIKLIKDQIEKYLKNNPSVKKEEKVVENEIELSNNLAYKFYTVIGACRDLDDTKRFRQIVKREYNLDTKVIQNEIKSWYLIYTKSSNKYSESIEELERMNEVNTKDIFIENVWIYSVKEK